MCDVCFDPSCAGDICNAPKPLDAEEVDPQSASSSTASLSSMPSLAAGTDEVTALISSSGGWSSSTITYGFANGASDYPSVMYSGYNEPSQFLHFSDMGKDILRDAFDKWGNVSGLTLTETSTPSNAVIRVGGSSVPDTAWAYSPGTYDANGDIWFGLDKSFFSKMVATSDVAYLGSYEYLVSLHEIGHTLGLKHPHSGSVIMDSAYDGLEYTVMSYRSYLGGPTSSYTVESWGYPQSLMMLDLAAIQELYGADFTALAGNTTYTFDPNTGEMYIDGVGQGTPGANRVFRTLWDGNGTDLIDLSNYTTDLAIDLNAGAGIDLDVGGFSQRAMLSFGSQIYASQHVYMSLLHQGDTRSLIENATGGTGNDSLIGNQIANVLNGGSGDDTLTGGLGVDTLILGSGADSVADSVAGLDGDTVTDFDIDEDSVLVTGTVLSAAQVSLNAAGALVIDTDHDGTAEATLALGLSLAAGSQISLATVGNNTEITFSPGGVTVPPVPDPDPVDPDMSFSGGASDNVFVGGTGNDTFLFRRGSDTATGNAGADEFLIDGRYIYDGDSHTITDLNFSEGDKVTFRFFGPNSNEKIVFDTQAELDSLLLRSDVSGTNFGSDLEISLTSGGGNTATLTLLGYNSINAATGTPTDNGSDDGGTVTLPPDPDMSFSGTSGGDVFVGGTGNDTFLFRFGQDTATGDAGADQFLIDGRYMLHGDSHTITDLDFSEGDKAMVRFFGATNEKLVMKDVDTLQSVINRADVAAGTTGNDLTLTFTESDTGVAASLTILDGALYDLTLA